MNSRPREPGELALFHRFLGEHLNEYDRSMTLEEAIVLFRQQSPEQMEPLRRMAALRWVIDEESRGHGTPFREALNRVRREGSSGDD